MRKVLYIIPYFYDELDEAWPIKYCNDLNCGFGVVGSIRTRPDGTPIEGDILVQGEDDVHVFLMAQPDVTVLQDPYEG